MSQQWNSGMAKEEALAVITHLLMRDLGKIPGLGANVLTIDEAIALGEAMKSLAREMMREVPGSVGNA
jgi:hypothetical protein